MKLRVETSQCPYVIPGSVLQHLCPNFQAIVQQTEKLELSFQYIAKYPSKSSVGEILSWRR